MVFRTGRLRLVEVAMISLHERREPIRLACGSSRRSSASSAGGTNPSRSAVRSPARSARGVDERLVDSERLRSAIGRLCPRPDQVEVPRRVLRKEGAECAVSRWSLRTRWLVPGAARASPRGRSIARGRAARAAPTATSSTAVPTKAISSLVWTLAGTRPTARTSRIVAPARNGAPRRRQPSVPSLPVLRQGSGSARSIPPRMLVINHRPSIRATSMSATVASAILLVSAST